MMHLVVSLQIKIDQLDEGRVQAFADLFMVFRQKHVSFKHFEKLIHVNYYEAKCLQSIYLCFYAYTLPTDQLFNLEFQFESVFNLQFQPKFGIQLGIPIPMGIDLGECINTLKTYQH